jgi:hypothetical protein
LRIKLSDVELDSIGVAEAILQRQASFNKTLWAAGAATLWASGAATRLDAFHGQITPHFLQRGYAGVKHHRSLRTVNTRASNSQGSDGRARGVRTGPVSQTTRLPPQQLKISPNLRGVLKAV